MREFNSLWLMGIGTVLLILGFSIVFMMVIKLMESNFFFNFLAYGASFIGFVLGITGVMKMNDFKH